jgi:hypothetical protein
MRVGVVCEGPSDFPAVACFFGHALETHGVTSEFVPLFPEMDKTRPEGGWANVLLWLGRNPPETRIQRYFGGGLFAGALSTEPLDAILIQLDGDALHDASFQNFVRLKHSYEVATTNSPRDKAIQIERIIALAGDFEAMTQADVARHIPAPAIEATETWCVAAFSSAHQNYEILDGQDLIDAFMTALERSEGRTPQAQYSNIDKSLPRRRRFCQTHATGSARIARGCPQFDRALARLTSLVN